MKGKSDDLKAQALAHGVDGLSNVVAGWAEAEGEAELAAAVRASGDAFEASVHALLTAAACGGSLKTGVSVGTAAGCAVGGPFGCALGAFLGGVAGAVISPACHRAPKDFAAAFSSSLEAKEALEELANDADCSGSSFAVASSADCAEECGDRMPERDWCVH